MAIAPQPFITFEGINGSGKTTHSHWLVNRLREKGISAVRVKEPTLPCLEDCSGLSDSGLSEALCYYAIRSMYLEKEIQPRLREGRWVICDRFCDSTFVYQGYAVADSYQKLKDLHRIVLDDFYPSLTLILDVDPMPIFEARIARQDVDRYESRGLAFQQKLREGFLRIAAEEAPRTALIDASGSCQAVQTQIEEVLSARGWWVMNLGWTTEGRDAVEGVGFEPT